MFANNITDKELISKIYKELIQTQYQHRNPNNLVKKRAEDVQMTNGT